MNNQEEQFTKQSIIESFQNLLKEETCIQEKDKVREFKIQFNALTAEEEQSQRAKFDAQEDKSEDDRFELIPNDLDDRFKELVGVYNEKVKTHKEKVAAQEKQNFIDKSVLIEQLKQLVENGMQNVGEAFKEFYEIQDKWNEIGQVNKSKFKQMQFDYSHYRDLFYHNVSIHHQLKDYDFKKNGDQKEAIVAELKSLLEQDSIKKMEREVKTLQSKWDSIGPTSNEHWETLKNNYWDSVNAIYEKIKVHYKALKEAQAETLIEKESLIEQIKSLYLETANFKSPKQWASLTENVNDLHKKWKETGFAGKAQEDKIWNEFKTITDDLRLKTNDFFSKLKDENSAAETAKKALIEKAESLKSSTDWKNTSKALIDLQKKWKSAGQAQRNIDQKLWEQFRAACDFFFNAKQEFFDTLDDRQAANLKMKNDIADKISSSTNEEELKQLIGEWQSVGFIPKNDIAKADTTFDKAVLSAAKTLNIDENNLNKLKFEAKIKAIKEDENAEFKLKSEKQFVETQIESIKEEIFRFEENMAYFGPSKGAQKLKEVVEKRMEESKLKLQDWQEKLKMLKF